MHPIINSLEQANLFFPGVLFSNYYDRLDRSPGPLTRSLAPLIKSTLGLGSSDTIEILHRYEATRLRGFEKRPLIDFDPPSIEILVVSAEKDFWFLQSVLDAGIRACKNPVSKITIIIPRDARSSLPGIVSKNIQIDVLDEEAFIDSRLFDKLRAVFGNRAGWILQQFLTLKFVEISNSPGVLTLDADTLLIEPEIWLDNNGAQLLHVSSEFVPGYYEFLEALGIGDGYPSQSHVTHHMMMQPKVLREIYKKYRLPHSEYVLGRAIEHHKNTKRLEYSLEFELYAQGIKSLQPELVEIRKFANKPVRLDQSIIHDGLDELIRPLKGKFRSISAHSYFQ